MKRMIFLFLFAALNLWADDVIICGQGGDDRYRGQFLGWGSQLQAHLQTDLNRNNVSLFLAEDMAQAGGQAARFKTLQSHFQNLKANHSANEDLYVYLIGHGSYMGGDSKLLLPGPDLSAGDLARWLQDVPAKRVIVIAALSSGAAFVNQLSGPNRIICSATKTVHEMYATEYMGLFVESLRMGSADRNRDSRISVHEACSQAAALTSAWYTGQGLIPTEHAILDDNGDGLGTRLTRGGPRESRPQENPDGDLASRVFLKNFDFPKKAPQDLIDAYLGTLAKVDKLKADKSGMDTKTYYSKLERYLIEAARTHRRIRSFAN